MQEKVKIVTNRLVLDELCETDIDFVVDLEQIPENKVYEMEGTLERDKIIEQCKEFFDGRMQLPYSGAIKLIIKLKDETPIGFVSLVCNWEKTQEWELGYGLLPEYFHNGYAYEGTKSVIQYAFKELNIHKLMAFVNANNYSSIKLLKNLQMKLEGHLREGRLIDGKWADEKVYAMLFSDFISLNC